MAKEEGLHPLHSLDQALVEFSSGKIFSVSRLKLYSLLFLIPVLFLSHPLISLFIPLLLLIPSSCNFFALHSFIGFLMEISFICILPFPSLFFYTVFSVSRCFSPFVSCFHLLLLAFHSCLLPLVLEFLRFLSLLIIHQTTICYMLLSVTHEKENVEDENLVMKRELASLLVLIVTFTCCISLALSFSPFSSIFLSCRFPHLFSVLEKLKL